MLTIDRKKSVRHRLLPENATDKRRNPLSLKSFVTFVSFVVRDSGQESVGARLFERLTHL
jgi:hypothetical protein